MLVKYSNGAQKKPHTIVKIGSTTFTDRTEAYAAAEKTAREFDPPDPWSIQSRSVYRDGQDGFLVMLEGATSTFHMSVRLVVAMS